MQAGVRNVALRGVLQGDPGGEHEMEGRRDGSESGLAGAVAGSIVVGAPL